MKVSLRKFTEEDVPLKVKWINDPSNNAYLHYDLPLNENSTLAWFYKTKDAVNRLDMTILADERPVGIIGLLGIDDRNHHAELYITVGEADVKGKGIAGQAMFRLLDVAFNELQLERVYLYTETGNQSAIRAYEKFGMLKEGLLRRDTKNRNGEYVNRYIFSILKDEFNERYGNNSDL